MPISHSSSPGLTRGSTWMAGARPAMTMFLIGALRPEHREALVRIEDVRFDVVDDLGLALQFVHRAAERHPVEELLLPGILDLRGRQLAPARQLARGQFVEPRSVAGIVRVEVMVLRREESVRPARRCDEGHPP